MNVQPLHDRVIVKRKETQTVTEAGIQLIKEHQPVIQEGFVVAVGTGVVSPEGTVVPLTVKEGDKILLPYKAGADIEIEGETYIMMKERDIYGIIRESGQ